MSGREPSGEPPAPQATQRLFFALWPDAAQRDALAHATHTRAGAGDGRPLPAHNLHVTLAFLGSVPVRRVAELGQIARRIAQAFPSAAAPLLLTFDRTEHWARPQILVALASAERAGTHFGTAAAGPQPAAGASALAATLKDATTAAGFSPDLKPFRAHVTVARKVRQPLAAHAMHAVQWHFDAFALVESRTHPAGPVYSVVESYPLVGAEKAHR